MAASAMAERKGDHIACEPHGDPTPALEARDGVLDPAARLAELMVVPGWAQPPRSARDADTEALGFRFIAQPVGIAALVAERAFRLRELRQQHQGLTVAHLTGGREKGQRSATPVADHVWLGVRNARRAPDCTRRRAAALPFLRPAAVRRAFG